MKHLIWLCTLHMLFCFMLFSQEAVQQEVVEIADSYAEYTEPHTEFISVAQTTLSIKSNISKINVYINSAYYGMTPFSTIKLSAGMYFVRLTKNGYYTREFYVELKEGRETYIYAELIPITGMVDFSITPGNAEIYVDGEFIYGRRAELSEGFHSVRIQKFGYQEYNTSVYVVRRRTQRLTVDLQTAVFNVSNLQLSKSIFNPHNPGLLGSIYIGFSVTAQETGIITIYNAGNDVIRKIPISPYTTWQQSVMWDGRNEQNEFVTDGTYSIVLETGGFIRKTSVAVNTHIQYTLLPNVRSALLPQESIATVFYGEPLFALTSPMGNTETGFVMTPLRFDFFGTPLSWLQFGLKTGLLISGYNAVPFLIGGSVQVKLPIPAQKLGTGIFLEYLFITDENLIQDKGVYTLDAGLKIGISAQWYNPVGFLLLFVNGTLGDLQGKITAFEADVQAGISSNFMLGISELELAVQYTFLKQVLSAEVKYGILLPKTNGIINIQVRLTHGKQKPLMLAPVIGFSLLF